MGSRRMTLTAIAGGLLAAGPVHAVQVDYVLEAGAEYDDNVFLLSDDPVGQTYARAGLGFLVRETSSSFQANISGRAEYSDYQDSTYSDSLEGALSGRVNWVAFPERLSFTVEDQLDLQAIDRFSPDTPDNRQQVNVFSAGPNLYFRPGRSFDGVLEARYVDTRADVTTEFNSSRYGAALRLTRQFAAGSRLSLNGQWQDVDFDNDLVARDYRRTDAFARYEREYGKLAFEIDAGYSQIDYDAGGRRRDPMFRGKIEWEAGARSKLTAIAVDQLSDAAASVNEAGTANTIPYSVLVNGTSLDSSAYHERRYSLAYTYTGTLLSLQVQPYLQKLDYLDAPTPDQTSRGAALTLDYRLPASMRLGFGADVSRIDYTLSNRGEDTNRYSVSLDKQWSRHWSSSLSYYRYERDSSQPRESISQNAWYASLRYQNR